VFKDGRKTIVEFASVLEDEARLKAETGVKASTNAQPPEPVTGRPKAKTEAGA
jgi:hypothetical protein